MGAARPGVQRQCHGSSPGEQYPGAGGIGAHAGQVQQPDHLPTPAGPGQLSGVSGEPQAGVVSPQAKVQESTQVPCRQEGQEAKASQPPQGGGGGKANAPTQQRPHVVQSPPIACCCSDNESQLSLNRPWEVGAGRDEMQKTEEGNKVRIENADIAKTEVQRNQWPSSTSSERPATCYMCRSSSCAKHLARPLRPVPAENWRCGACLAQELKWVEDPEAVGRLGGEGSGHARDWPRG